jgi:beta-N-acetylhexosaminidase
MTGFSGTRPGPALLARIRAGEVGGVILFARNIAGPAAAHALVIRLQRAAASGGNLPLLVAVDQEGGTVRRFAAGPPDVPPAEIRTPAAARAEGAATGRYLRGAGVNVDLAPVLDAPDSASSFLGSRAFGGDPAVVSRLGTAFAGGLQAEGVAATAKHFPGLGTAPLSTDTSHVWITTPRAALDARLAPFAAAIRRGVELVMVGNAGYAALDPSGLPAVLSRPIVTGLLRNELGFRGVVISDVLEAPGPSSRPRQALTAAAAGVDVLLYTSEADSAAAYHELLAAARSGALPASTLRAADTRIATLKRRIG